MLALFLVEIKKYETPIPYKGRMTMAGKQLSKMEYFKLFQM